MKKWKWILAIIAVIAVVCAVWYATRHVTVATAVCMTTVVVPDDDIQQSADNKEQILVIFFPAHRNEYGQMISGYVVIAEPKKPPDPGL